MFNDLDFRIADWALDKVEHQVWRRLLFVSLAPGAPLELQLCAAIDGLTDEQIENFSWVREERLIFDAKWKIYTDDFVEG